MRDLPFKRVVMEASHAAIRRTLFGLLLLHFALFSYVNAFAFANATNSKPQPLAALCNSTSNASLCFATLSKYPSSKPSALLQDLTAYVVAQALAETNRTYRMGKKLAAHEEVAGDKFTLQDCLELMDGAVDGLNSSVDRLSHLDASAPPSSLRGQIMDVRVWLSTSLTDLDTCWDELSDPKAGPLKSRLSNINKRIEPLLAIALSLAETLQEDGGASTSYALPRHPKVHR